MTSWFQGSVLVISICCPRRWFELLRRSCWSCGQRSCNCNGSLRIATTNSRGATCRVDWTPWHSCFLQLIWHLAHRPPIRGQPGFTWIDLDSPGFNVFGSTGCKAYVETGVIDTGVHFSLVISCVNRRGRKFLHTHSLSENRFFWNAQRDLSFRMEIIFFWLLCALSAVSLTAVRFWWTIYCLKVFGADCAPLNSCEFRQTCGAMPKKDPVDNRIAHLLGWKLAPTTAYPVQTHVNCII